MTEIDIICKRYGVLPSQVIKGDFTDFCFDYFVASIAITDENKAIEKQNRDAKKQNRKYR